MTKDEILAGYLNTSYYGRGAYGIQAAAQAYYGVDARTSTSPRAPTSPRCSRPPASTTGRPPPTPARSSSRSAGPTRSTTWSRGLAGRGRSATKLTFPEPHTPKAAPGCERPDRLPRRGRQRASWSAQGVTTRRCEAGGWTITLDIDKKKQKALEKSVDAAAGAPSSTARSSKVDATVQAGATSVDPKTGKVVALYGGVGPREHYMSNATRRDYQPASTFKPLVLASALENESTTQNGQPDQASTPSTTAPASARSSAATPRFAPQNEDDRQLRARHRPEGDEQLGQLRLRADGRRRRRPPP